MNLLCREQNAFKTNRNPPQEPAGIVGGLTIAIPLILVLGLSAVAGTQQPAVAQERNGAPSAEGDAGPRQAAEQEGQHRSPESEASPRRSAESEAGRRRAAEDERGTGSSAEAEGRQDSNALGGFQPQTDREAALYRMIIQLQNEMAALRREVSSRRDGDRVVSRSRDGDAPGREMDRKQTVRASFVLPAGWQNTKDGRVFKAYDKNGDEIVSLDEWLAMTNGNVSSIRREMQTQRFNEAEPSGDGKFTPAEFIYWYSIARHKTTEGPRRARDGDGGDAARDGEGVRSGPRDGEVVKRGPRDGEVEKTDPRDGDRP